MALGENVSGLLNLAVFAVASALSYIGLDRFDPTSVERSRSRNLARAAIEKIKDQIDSSRWEFDISKDMIFQKNINIFLRSYFLNYVGGNSQNFNIFGFVFSFIRAPLFIFFMGGMDVIAVYGMAIHSFFSFLVITASTLWEMPFIYNIYFGRWEFLALSIEVSIIVIMIYYKYKGFSINNAVSRTYDEVSVLIAEIIIKKYPEITIDIE